MRWIKKGCITVVSTVFLTVAACFAVWAADAIPTVSIKVTTDLQAGNSPGILNYDGGSGDGTHISVSSDQYVVWEANWVTSTGKDLVIGEEPRLTVTLTPVDEGQNYFKSSYKAGSIKINGGTYVSSRKNGSDLIVTLKLKPIKGVYDSPADAYWKDTNLGVAVWKPEKVTSGAYEVWLYRGKKVVHKVSQVKNTTYNFYPYMEEEGTYTFQVRTVPHTDIQLKSGKRSDWMESGELLIKARDVSDGKGKGKEIKPTPGSEDKRGWIKESGKWYYYEQPNVPVQGGWRLINEQWYLFNVDGSMMTGWQLLEGRWYYMTESGPMLTGWLKENGKWYYLNPDITGPEGVMLTGWQVVDGYTYCFQPSGAASIGWLKYEDTWYYFNTVEGSLEGAMLKGWIKRDEKTYYTNEQGARQVGWQEIDGNWYYFYPSDGSMATDTYIGGFYVDGDGINRKQ